MKIYTFKQDKIEAPFIHLVYYLALTGYALHGFYTLMRLNGIAQHHQHIILLWLTHSIYVFGKLVDDTEGE